MVKLVYNKCFILQIAYTEEYEQQRGKGSFPAMITPGYHFAKKAQENASDVSSFVSLLSELLYHALLKKEVCVTSIAM